MTGISSTYGNGVVAPLLNGHHSYIFMLQDDGLPKRPIRGGDASYIHRVNRPRNIGKAVGLIIGDILLSITNTFSPIPIPSPSQFNGWINNFQSPGTALHPAFQE